MTAPEDFEKLTVDALLRDVKRANDDAGLAHDLDLARLERLAQANRMRRRFFKLAAWLSGTTVGTSVVMVIAVILGRNIQPTVAVGFISGLAVETVGVLAIMAGYLFPKNGGSDQLPLP